VVLTEGGGTAISGAVPRSSDRLRGIGGRTGETSPERFYEVVLAPWLMVEPDLQYIVPPGGDGENALAPGLQFEVGL
jgi:carbohydrate-selective porin OprB